MDDKEVEESRSREDVRMEGLASIALLPCGSISGHFIHLPDSICYGLHGSGSEFEYQFANCNVLHASESYEPEHIELACERECSRGEDYRFIKLTITDYNRKKERSVIVECRGHDAARFHSIGHAHGWEKDIMGMVEQKRGENKITVSFECETLKAEDAAQEHLRQFLPKLAGLDVVVNIGPMTISGLEFETEEAESEITFCSHAEPIVKPS